MARDAEIRARVRLAGDDEVRASFARMGDSGRATFESINRSARESSTFAERTATVADAVGRSATQLVTVSFGALGGVVSGLGDAALFAARQIGTIAEAAGVTGVVAGAGIAGASYAVSGFTNRNYAAIASIETLAEKTGLSVESISAWQAAVRLAGGSTEDFDKSINNLTRLYLEVGRGNDHAQAPFLSLGVAAVTAEGRLRPFRDVMSDVTTAIAQIPDASRRAMAAVQVFGDSYESVLDVIRTDVDGATMADKLAYAYSHGTVLSQDYVNALHGQKSGDTETREDLRDIGNTITYVFLPLTSNNLKFFADNKEEIKSFVLLLADAAVSIKEDLTTIVDGSNEDLNFEWMERARPVVETLRDVFIDLWRAANGTADLGDTVPALRQLADVLSSLVGVASAAWQAFSEFASTAKLPTLAQALAMLSAALDSFASGLVGVEDRGAAVYPIIQGLGNAAREAIGILTELGAAASSVLNDSEINKGNFFEFLNPIIAGLKASLLDLKSSFEFAFGPITTGRIRGVLISVLSAVASFAGEVAEYVIGIFSGGLEYFDRWQTILRLIAEASGYVDKDGNGSVSQMLAGPVVLLAIGQWTGLTQAIAASAFALVGFLTIVKIFIALFKNYVQIAVAVLTPVVAAIGVPAGLVGTVSVAIALALAAIWFYWGSIKEAFGSGLDWIKTKTLDSIDWMSDAWKGFASTMEGIIDSIGKMFESMFEKTKSLIRVAADGLSALFGVSSAHAAEAPTAAISSNGAKGAHVDNVLPALEQQARSAMRALAEVKEQFGTLELPKKPEFDFAALEARVKSTRTELDAAVDKLTSMSVPSLPGIDLQALSDRASEAQKRFDEAKAALGNWHMSDDVKQRLVSLEDDVKRTTKAFVAAGGEMARLSMPETPAVDIKALEAGVRSVVKSLDDAKAMAGGMISSAPRVNLAMLEEAARRTRAELDSAVEALSHMSDTSIRDVDMQALSDRAERAAMALEEGKSALANWSVSEEVQTKISSLEDEARTAVKAFESAGGRLSDIRLLDAPRVDLKALSSVADNAAGSLARVVQNVMDIKVPESAQLGMFELYGKIKDIWNSEPQSKAAMEALHIPTDALNGADKFAGKLLDLKQRLNDAAKGLDGVDIPDAAHAGVDKLFESVRSLGNPLDGLKSRLAGLEIPTKLRETLAPLEDAARRTASAFEQGNGLLALRDRAAEAGQAFEDAAAAAQEVEVPQEVLDNIDLLRERMDAANTAFYDARDRASDTVSSAVDNVDLSSLKDAADAANAALKDAYEAAKQIEIPRAPEVDLMAVKEIAAKAGEALTGLIESAKQIEIPRAPQDSLDAMAASAARVQSILERIRDIAAEIRVPQVSFNGAAIDGFRDLTARIPTPAISTPALTGVAESAKSGMSNVTLVIGGKTFEGFQATEDVVRRVMRELASGATLDRGPVMRGAN